MIIVVTLGTVAKDMKKIGKKLENQDYPDYSTSKISLYT